MKAVASVKTKPGKDAKGGKQTKKQLLRGKNAQKKKKEHLRFGVDCTNIAEDNIMDVADFVSIWILIFSTVGSLIECCFTSIYGASCVI